MTGLIGFFKFLKRVQKNPQLINFCHFILGWMTGLIRKMTENSTCELSFKASYYNY